MSQNVTNLISPPISPISPILSQENLNNIPPHQLKKNNSKDLCNEGMSTSVIFPFTSCDKCDRYHLPNARELIKIIVIVSFISVHFFSFMATYAWYLCINNNNFLNSAFIKPEWLSPIVYSKFALRGAIALQLFIISSLASCFFKNLNRKNEKRESV